MLESALVRRLLGLALVALSLSASSSAVAGKIYWTDRGELARQIRAADRGGGAFETISTETSSPVAIDIDLSAGKLYWADSDLSAVARSDLDGSRVEWLFEDAPSIVQIAVDSGRQKIYWTNGDELIRADTNGANREQIAAGAALLAVEFNLAKDRVFWASDKAVRYAEPDGSNVREVIANFRYLHAIAVDDVHDQAYLSTTGSGEIFRIDLDGSDLKLISTDSGLDIALDVPNGQIYLSYFTVRRMDVTGKNVTTVSNAIGDIRGIVLDGPSCGDGYPDPGEDCDDGGTADGDGCPAGCHWVCGNGIEEPGEQCDDGDTIDGDGCDADCTITAQALVDQFDHPSGTGLVDTDFGSGYHAYDSEGADDFIVTDPRGWDVSEVRTAGYKVFQGDPVIEFLRLGFHADLGGIPSGVSSCVIGEGNQNAFTDDDGSLRVVFLPVCHLEPGHWWLTQQVRIGFTGHPVHYWSTRTVGAGDEALWRQPGDGFATGCIDWTPLTLCSSEDPAFMFQVLAQVTSPDPVPSTGPFGAILIVISLFGGAAYLIRRRR